MDTDKIFQSRALKCVIIGGASLVALTLVFSLGVFVGAKKANFSFAWADQYHRNFGGPQGGFFGDFMGMADDFTNSSGVFGQILKIEGSSLTVNDKDNLEKIVLIEDKTSIVRQMNKLKLSDLKVDDVVVIIGGPNNAGQIRAKLIRVMPQPSPRFINN